MFHFQAKPKRKPPPRKPKPPVDPKPHPKALQLSLAELDGEWQATDGARLKIKNGSVYRNGAPYNSLKQESNGTVSWVNGWYPSGRTGNSLLWNCTEVDPDFQVQWWPAVPRHLRRAECEFDVRPCASSEVPQVESLITQRLPGLSAIRGLIEPNTSIGLFDRVTAELFAVTTVKFHPKCDFAEMLFLSSGQSSQGFGSILMRHVKQLTRDKGLHYIVVQASNDAVQYFKKKKFIPFDPEIHLSRDVFMRQIYKPTNVTLMVFDLAADLEYVSDQQRATVAKCSVGDSAQVQYGIDTRRPSWRDGRIKKIEGVRVHIEFESHWKSEWLPIDSVRLKILNECITPARSKRTITSIDLETPVNRRARTSRK